MTELAEPIGIGFPARGWPVGLIVLIGGFGYSAPPRYKYKVMGIRLVFALMGPLMVMGSHFVVTGSLAWEPLLASLPIGLLVVAFLHGNEWRDLNDARYGSGTLSTHIGRRWSHLGYPWLACGACLVLALGELLRMLPVTSLLALGATLGALIVSHVVWDNLIFLFAPTCRGEKDGCQR